MRACTRRASPPSLRHGKNVRIVDVKRDTGPVDRDVRITAEIRNLASTMESSSAGTVSFRFAR